MGKHDTSDDRDWFKHNPKRSHRARLPFMGEIDEEAIKASDELALVMLIRQIEPGSRLRAVVDLSADFLPVPDDEATIHALFEVGMGRETMPADVPALVALVERYKAKAS